MSETKYYGCKSCEWTGEIRGTYPIVGGISLRCSSCGSHNPDGRYLIRKEREE